MCSMCSMRVQHVYRPQPLHMHFPTRPGCSRSACMYVCVYACMYVCPSVCVCLPSVRSRAISLTISDAVAVGGGANSNTPSEVERFEEVEPQSIATFLYLALPKPLSQDVSPFLISEVMPFKNSIWFGAVANENSGPTSPLSPSGPGG